MSDKKIFADPWTKWIGSLFVGLVLPAFTFRLLKYLWLKPFGYDMSGKVVVVTGASSGLGEALAHEFYKSGCKVVLCARRRDELERVRMDLLQTYSTVPTAPPVIMEMDLSKGDTLKEAIDKILDITGDIDVLVNNAGISHRSTVLETQPDVDRQIMNVNYFGTVTLTKAVLPRMVEQQHGQIIFVNSVQGVIGIPFRSAYAASKHALHAFADSLRAEVHDSNIQVMSVIVGYIRTSLSFNALTGKGAQYSKLDAATEKGYDPMYVAKRIVVGVQQREKEIVISTITPRIAILLRKYLPSLYFYVMARRARASE